MHIFDETILLAFDIKSAVKIASQFDAFSRDLPNLHTHVPVCSQNMGEESVRHK